MIYIVGSDLESQYGAATRSIKQILDSGIDLTKNNVLIRTGGTNKWKSKILSNKTMTYQVTAEGLKAVKEEPVQDMASKNTLSSFLTYCYRNYKTKSYDLILWDHGGGPTMGYGYDEVSKNVMSLSELDAALNGSPFRSGNKLEMVGFDACLMSSVEVAFLLSDNSDYLVASQETIPGWGWDYSFLGTIKPSTSSVDVTKTIIDAYYSQCEKKFKSEPRSLSDVTLSCLDLSKTPQINSSLSALYTDADNGLTMTSFPQASRIRESTKEFGTFSTAYSFDLIDIKNLCERMAGQYPDESRKVSQAIDDLVVYNKTNVSNANGVSMYFPYRNRDAMAGLSSLYKQTSFDDGYSDYMVKFSELMLSKPMADWSVLQAQAKQETATEYSVQLTPEQVKTYKKASFFVLVEKCNDKPDGSGNKPGYYYYYVYGSRDVILDESGKLIANYNKKMQKVRDNKTGETGLCSILESPRTKDHLRFQIPLIFFFVGDDLSFEITGGWLQMQTDLDGRNSQILSVVPSYEETGSAAPRELIDVYHYQDVEFPYYGRKLTRDKKGNLKYYFDWEETSLGYAHEIKLDQKEQDSFSFVQEDLKPSDKAYLIFNISDVQGNIVSSELIPVKSALPSGNAP